MTANAVLRGEINGQKTYSVYFGQTFEPSAAEDNFVENKPAASKVRFGNREVYNISSVSDLKHVPSAFETQDLVNSFNRFFHDGVSNVSVYKIINIVYIFRKLVVRRKVKRFPTVVSNLL